VLAVVAAGLVGAQSAHAARPSPAAVTFVLLTGPHAGDRVRTDGGPNVPARLNAGRVSGRLAPQSGGNEFTFRGTVRGRGARAADNPDAAALPETALSPMVHDVASVIEDEELAISRLDTLHISLARAGLGLARLSLRDMFAHGQIANPTYSDLVGKLNAATGFDNTAFKQLQRAKGQPAGSRQRAATERAAVTALQDGIATKRQALSTLTELAKFAAVIPSEPPPTPVTQPPLDLGVGEALAISSRTGAIAGTQDPSTPGSRGFVCQNGRLAFLGPPGSAFFAFGPSGSVGGQLNGQPIMLPSVAGPLTALPKGNATGGAVRAGDLDLFVGFVDQRAAPFERAATWFRAPGSGSRAQASRLRFTGFKVGRFTGGASLFTVSGRLAFGDHFDRGTTGPFRAFRVDLRTGVLTELFRPAGGSSQPLASNRARIGAGASRFANGALQATYWWGGQHYLRFGGPGTDSLVAGMNEAGVGVGAIGPPGDHHAALFERGVAYDLNTLIPPGSGWTLTKANAISNAGVIVGTGVLNGQQRAFALDLATPRH
jgi:hypothetical protein